MKNIVNCTFKSNGFWGPLALGLLLASCTGSFAPVGGLLDTNIEDLPDQVFSEDEDSPIIAAFKARNKAPSGGVEVVAISSDTNLLPHPTITLNPETEEYSLSMIPTGNGSGIVTVTITVTLGTRVKVKEISVTVIAVNRAPEIEAIADVSLTQGSSLTGINFDVSDLETAAADLTVAVSSNNQTLLPNANITLSGSGATRSLAINPVASQSGVAVVTVTVTDAAGLSSTEQLNVTVSASGGGGGGGAPNTAPTISAITDQTISEDGNTGALAFTVGDTEQAANTLVVTAASSNTTLIPLASIALAGTGASRSLLITPPANLNGGPVTITLTVSDGILTTDEVFTVTVNSVNDAPTVSQIGDQSTNEDTNTGAIAFTIGDVETAAGSLTLGATSDNTTVVPNANLTLGGSGTSRTISILPASNQSGTANITITVGDGTTTTNMVFEIIVDPINDAPTLTAIANQAIPMNGNTGALAFTIGDVETAVGSLTVTRASSNITKVPLANVVLGGSGANRTVTVTPANGQTGTVTITVTVGDGTTTTDETFDVEIIPPPSNLSYGRSNFLFSITMPVSVSLIPTVTGTVDSYSISPALTGTGLSFDTSTGEISGTKPTATFGPTLYTVRATNAGGSTNVQINLHSMDAFYIVDTGDSADTNPGDGECSDGQATPTCSLRGAIQESNALAGTQSIIIPANTNIDISSGGPLEIDSNINIYGEQATTSIVDAASENRAIISNVNNVTINLTRFEIRNALRASAEGGAIFLTGNTLNVDQMRFKNNSSQAGGAINMSDSFGSYTTNLTVTKSYFESNSATAGDGGAIKFDGTNLTISDTSFKSNSASQNGGAIFNSDGTVSIQRNLFETNSASYGGALNIWDGTTTLINNTFSANSASNQGGAVVGVNSATIAVTNNTFYFNSGAGGGGAFATFGASISIKNSLFDQNTGSSGNPHDCTNGGYTSTGYNLTNTTFALSDCGFAGGTNDIQSTDPTTEPLADNGGYTLTHLIAVAPAVDGGTNTGCPAVDGRGLNRSDGSCDIGAFEVQ